MQLRCLVVGTTINTVIFPTLARMAARKEWAAYAHGSRMPWAFSISCLHLWLYGLPY